MTERTFTVGQVADLAGVSVRTLHHYDTVGLVVPSSRSASGYRLYRGADLERLQQVLVWRRLGFALEQVADLLDASGLDRREALVRQRDLLDERLEQLTAVRALVERTLRTIDEGTTMGETDMFDGLVEWNERTHGAEVRERWGGTDAYAESSRRTAGYSAADWAAMQAEAEEVEQAFAALLDAGVPAEDPRAMDAAEAHRAHLDRWFYPCSHEMHAGLADMYVADERFAAHYERRRAGLAGYVRDAVLANGLRAVGAGEGH